MPHTQCYMFRIKKKKWSEKRKRFIHSVVGWLTVYIIFYSAVVLGLLLLLLASASKYYLLLSLVSACSFLLFPFVMLINGFIIFDSI